MDKANLIEVKATCFRCGEQVSIVWDPSVDDQVNWVCPGCLKLMILTAWYDEHDNPINAPPDANHRSVGYKYLLKLTSKG